ncbi:MAG TPA: hypothetical protein VHZ24_20810 [Pirellulales bacterium]|jgi:hypothetical protein|nr:hypothetical protein [Pirellulales bacterium]
MSDVQSPAVAFPGISQIRGCWYTRSAGLSPGIAVLEIAPQVPMPLGEGTLELSFDGSTIRLPGCRVDSHRMDLDANGRVCRLVLMDRRWKWCYGAISGRYNQRRRDGTLIDATARTPAELATLCLRAMGERDFNVARLPSLPRPAVEWGHANPAQALAVLVESHRCQVVLKLDDTVSIQPITDDEPTTAADGNVQWDSLAVETVEQPGGIVFVGAPSQYQLDFELEAVGVDVDGSVRPIGELSYRPDIAGAASAWSLIDLPFFNSLVDRLQRQLARESLFRWYRVKAAQGIDHAIEQCALLPHRLAAAHSDGAQQYISQPQVFGIWHDPQRDGTFDDSAAELMPLPLGPSDSATDTCCSVPFEFDSEARLIKFARPVYQLLADDGSGYQLAPATLMLRTAAHLLESNGSSADSNIAATSASRAVRRARRGTSAGRNCCCRPRRSMARITNCFGSMRMRLSLSASVNNCSSASSADYEIVAAQSRTPGCNRSNFAARFGTSRGRFRSQV